MELAGADRGGRLLAGAGDGSGRARIRLRDARTGALLRSSGRFLGVSEPRLGGGAGGVLWITQATGMADYVERLDARTLKPRPGRRSRRRRPTASRPGSSTGSCG
jgi:hypothetical protein